MSSSENLMKGQRGQPGIYPEPQGPPQWAQQMPPQYNGGQSQYQQYPPQQPQYYQQQPAGYNQPSYPPQQPYYAPPPPQNYGYSGPQNNMYPPPPPPPLQTSNDEKFKKVGPKDLWAALLFIVMLIGFAVSAYFGISHLTFSDSTNHTNSTTPTNGSTTNNGSSFSLTASQVGTLIAISVGTGFVFTSVYFMLMIKYAGELIHITFIMSIILNFVMAIYLFYIKQYLIAIIWVIFSFLVMLSNVTALAARFWGTIVVGFAGLIIGAVWYILWVLATTGILQDASTNNWNSAAVYVLIIFMVFCFYWTSQVISNVVHVTVSGTFAHYYFLGTGVPGGRIQVSGTPTVGSLGRAMTTSFGSICYGSLVIALLQTLRTMLQMAQNQAAQDGNIIGMFCIICANCCLGIIEQLIQYFNVYAFTQVAIYGKDYCDAAKATWALVKSRGVDAIINDNLIGNVLAMGGLLVGLLSGFIGFIWAKFSDGIPATASYYVTIVIICFFIGFSEFSILAEVINSGVVTTFVCLAEDPNALARTKPELYEAIRETYPQVAYAAV
ncbi:hypothetical protein SmJEL517_g05328 [Synchytrium microbalum]|uniref:Protein PNS1 n=1 Tax=Synchytrium microbalum TaxID=1806994 RepID=A0A507BVQ1_9FUNG|nr:uncharacterized protein SmJEL517_g05328 [Synchytrium microbalum]TPX31288.1 hypothetical protein SmJEL517_g05328 [Synchytrium microbalum]